MVNVDYYASAGFALELLAQSPYHKSLALGDYFRTEVLPALWAKQTRFYLRAPLFLAILAPTERLARHGPRLKTVS